MSRSGNYILFDMPGGKAPVDTDYLVRLGHPVEICNGPGESACPLVEGKGCPLAENAGGIVFELDLGRTEHRAVLKKYKSSLRPDMPLRVAVHPGQEHEYAELLHGVRVWTHEPVAGDLDALEAEVSAANRVGS